MKQVTFIKNKLYWLYITGFAVILFLPLLTLQPWFFPPDFGKTIVFRSIIALLIFLFAFQFLYQKNQLSLPSIKNNKIIWFLGGLFVVFLLATFFSTDMRFSLWGSPSRAGGFINFASYIIFAILAFIIIKKSDWKRLWIFGICIGAAVSLIAICQFYGLLGNIFLHFPNNPPSTLGNSTFMAIFLLLLFFQTLFFFIKEPFEIVFNKTNIVKIAYGLALLLFLWVILISGSRAAYLGLLIGFVYFVLSYPKRLHTLKIISVVILLIAIGGIYFANTNPEPPTFVAQNKILNAVYPRLSIKLFLNDSRFYGWQIAWNAFKEKPIVGWGPENFSVGFDKHYDPSLPYVSDAVSDWWDRAHNIFFDLGVQAGVLGIIAYFTLFIGLFWHLQKTKHTETASKDSTINIHLLQTTLIAYLIANIFSFDNFATYLLFFFIIGYSLFLIELHKAQKTTQESASKHTEFIRKWKNPIIGALGILLLIFLWQYNLKPLSINAQINKADILVSDKKCPQAFVIMENIMKQPSILDARARMQYVEFMNLCASMHPENNLTYATRGVQILKEATQVQPLFSRLWIFLGGFTNVQASLEKDPAKKTALLQEAYNYLQKADELAPDHQELILEQAKNSMIAQNFTQMNKDAQKCVDIYPGVGTCYFMRALSKVYLNDLQGSKEDLVLAQNNRYDIRSLPAINQLVNTYTQTENYLELAEAYRELIELQPHVAQYHASLAFAYRELKDYQNARAQALIFLKMMPEAKDEVEAFLKTLPR